MQRPTPYVSSLLAVALVVGEVRRLVQLRTGSESPPALLAAVSGADVLYVRVATPAPRTVAGAAR